MTSYHGWAASIALSSTERESGRTPTKLLHPCANGCGAMVAPPRKFCAPCGDQRRETQAREARRRKRKAAHAEPQVG